MSYEPIPIFAAVPGKIAAAFLRGSRSIKILVALGVLFLVGGVLSYFALGGSPFRLPTEPGMRTVYIPLAIAVFGYLILTGVASLERTMLEKQEIETAQERLKENPNEAKAAWDLARIKLENYLNRNLTQIRWIFFLTLLVMMIGFVLISYGVVRVYQNPSFLSPSIVVTLSGVVVEFIGASFLLIYKSTMEQAQNYVTVLERINAVGMSVQILDSIEATEVRLRNHTKADLAKKLLSMYGSLK
jgi:hypothetical protein